MLCMICVVIMMRSGSNVSLAYAFVDTLIDHFASPDLTFFENPNWSGLRIVRFILIGFPMALIIAWVFFFQAEDGIRDVAVTGVQTCALPISLRGWSCAGVSRQTYDSQRVCNQPAIGRPGHDRLLDERPARRSFVSGDRRRQCRHDAHPAQLARRGAQAFRTEAEGHRRI